MSLTISVFSDVICPWCFLGKHRLERALDALDLRSSTTLEWLPFELNPDMPAEGLPRATYRARKFGPERSAALDAQMTELGRAEGLTFAFERLQVTPNTRDAHRLIAAAQDRGRGDAAVDGLFRAYFQAGEDVGDPAVLRRLADAAGLDGAAWAQARTDGGLDARITALEAQAAQMQIGGVPFFIVDRRWAVSGAQDTEAWIAALRARRDEASGMPAA
ncbi:disulfide bond formation protein DsbA [Methylobacterium sp. Leaf104]|uniref:DsbA family oxidoreductase n=1 Tax=Methylobacterium TaxID=407 RepID=UPI0006F81F6F|nr:MULTISPECIES: DsbA family oxidoreductase [Methylobacterium]KQP38294.1 disulfide bond formation protein DsbA [Methylobacterium sp. Leaf104]MCI9880314.1 DsbA family oxidoreductase [Methylobacterium goesingense]